MPFPQDDDDSSSHHSMSMFNWTFGGAVEGASSRADGEVECLIAVKHLPDRSGPMTIISIALIIHTINSAGNVCIELALKCADTSE